MGLVIYFRKRLFYGLKTAPYLLLNFGFSAGYKLALVMAIMISVSSWVVANNPLVTKYLNGPGNGITVQVEMTIGACDADTMAIRLPKVTDNCDNHVDLIWNRSDEAEELNAPLLYGATTTVHFTATDNAGNQTAKELVITVKPRPVCKIETPQVPPPVFSSGHTLLAAADVCIVDYHWQVEGDGWYITDGNGTPTITYTSGSGVGLFTLTVTDENNCQSACDYTISPLVNRVACACTQGFYGNEGGLYCDGRTTTKLLTDLLSEGDLVLGDGENAITLTSADVPCILQWFPAGGSATTLRGVSLPNGDCANLDESIKRFKKGNLKNEFLGQILTLALNLRLDDALGEIRIDEANLATFAITGCSEPADKQEIIPDSERYFIFPQVVVGLTIAELFELANTAIAGHTTISASIEEINEAIDVVNNAFDACRQFSFISEHQLDENYGTPDDRKATSIEEVSSDGAFYVTASPNPFKKSTTIEFTVEYDTEVTVEVFNTIGQLVDVIFDANAKSGSTVKTLFVRKFTEKQVYFYKVTTNKETAVGKLISE